jgi:transcriptional regulator with XRE-family HTH domain
MVSMLRVARLLRQESLDDVALAIGSVKSHLSELERRGGRHTSRTLRDKLSEYFDAPWAVLVRQTDGKKLAAALLAGAAKQQKAA